MMQQTFGIEAVVNFMPDAHNNVGHCIAEVADEYNYLITNAADNTFILKPFARPVNRDDIDYCIKAGTIEFVKEDDDTLLRLSYTVSYSGEVWIICFNIFQAYFFHWAILFSAVIIAFYFYRIKQIRSTMETMLDQIVFTNTAL